MLTHGKGAYVWDTQDRKYLDFCAGIAVNALGHADDGVAKVSSPTSPVTLVLFAWPVGTESSAFRSADIALMHASRRSLTSLRTACLMRRDISANTQAVSN